ncbi:MAG: FecR family protein [Gallionella sp.]
MSPQKSHSKLARYIIVLVAFSAAYPITGYCAAAGRADFVIGKVQAVAADGSSRTLRRGAVINTGDAIITSARSRAQVRFIDGGFISLQPNTEFRVDEFEYQSESKSEPKSFFSLLRGGLRAITGAIGRIKRNNYKVVTATATIGIRGTGYTAEIRDGGLFVSVGEGAISLTNNAGQYVVSTGNAAFVANMNTAPAKTTQRPRIPPARIQPFISRITALKADLPRLTTDSGYTRAYSFIINNIAPNSGTDLLPVVAAQFDQLSRFNVYSDGQGNNGARGDAISTFAATDGIIGWGRWVGNTNPNGTAPGPLAPGIFHYVIGQATPLLKLPKGQASYQLMGFTNPSALNSNGWRVNDASLTANFVTSQVSVNMQLANASTIYNVNGVATITGPAFSSAGLSTSSPTGTCIISACSTTVKGFFAGDNASRAGLSYEVQDVGTVSEFVQGAAVFKQTATSAAPAGV